MLCVVWWSVETSVLCDRSDGRDPRKIISGIRGRQSPFYHHHQLKHSSTALDIGGAVLYNELSVMR